MDDELDYGDEQPQQQQQPSWSQVAQSLPFDESARQQLGRYQSAMGWVQDQVHDGSLHPHEGEQYAQQLMGRIGPLVQRQQQTEQLAQQKQVQDAMHAAAMGAMVQNENTRAQMAVLPHSVQKLPTEHGDIYLAPDGKGGVQQLDAPEPRDVPELDMAAPGQPDGGGEESGAPPAQGGQFRQVIQNGAFTDVYEGGRLVSTDRPQQPQTGSAGRFQPPPDLMSAWRQQAQFQTAGMRPAAAAQAQGRIVAQYHHAWLTQKQHEEDFGAKAKAATDRESAKEKQKQNDDHADRWNKSYEHHLGELQKEFNRVRSPGAPDKPNPDYVAPEDRPPEFKDRAGMEQEAKRRADDAHVSAYGEDHLPETRRKERQKAGSNSPVTNSPGIATGAQQPANESPPGGPGAGPTGTNAAVPPADAIKQANDKVAAAEAAIKAKAESDPEAAKVLAWDQAHKAVAANTAALPEKATEEQKWLAQRPAMTASQLADLYDAHRAARLYDVNAGGTHQSAIDDDERNIRESTHGLSSAEEWKAGHVVSRGITPQQVQAMHAENQQKRNRRKGKTLSLDQKASLWLEGK